jgi:hypothetical protein
MNSALSTFRKVEVIGTIKYADYEDAYGKPFQHLNGSATAFQVLF